jgi:4-hydroxy-tetrahydrodipicolinate synthase
MECFYGLQTRLMPLHKALFVESSPAPVKYAASVLGLCSDEVRLPLVPASAKARAAVDEALQQSGLITPEDSDKLRRHG